MKYNFDEIIDRSHTDAVKVERCKALFGSEKVLPLWVADMDFRTPDFIIDTLKLRLEHPILGYTIAPRNLFPLISQWLSDHHQWEVKKDWIGYVRGIVPALSLTVQCFTEPGDEVIVQTPVYYPFFNVIRHNHRTLLQSQLLEINGKFEMDFEDFERQISPKTKMFVLCNPHNPGGRVWSKEDLLKIDEICTRHNVLVISDEIHADMVLSGHKHIPYATISETAANNSITLMAPSKVFNMPGLISSYYIVPNEKLRKQYTDYLEVSEMNQGNMFAYAATVAAFEKGEEWRVQMLAYVEDNVKLVADFLKNNIPQIVPMIPEASFLVWLDCQQLGMETDDLHRFFSLDAGLGLNKGTIFGPGGEYHLRLNVACSRLVLQQALEQLKVAVDQLLAK